MFSIRRLSGADFLCLAVVLGVALAGRIWYLNAYADGGTEEGRFRVQGTPAAADLKSLVTGLVEQRSFSSTAPLAGADEPTAHVAPGYAWMLSWIDRGPTNLGTLDRTVRWLQCFLGSGTAVFYFLIAMRAFGSQAVAWLAGLLCALHPYWIVNAAEINDGVVATFLLALGVWLSMRAVQDAGLLSGLLAGVALAGLALTRASTLPFIFVLLLWMVWRCRVVRSGWLCALLALLGFCAALVPWELRNYRLYGDFIPVADSGPLHLWIGNNPAATGGPLDQEAMFKGLSESRGQADKDVRKEMGEASQKSRYDALARDAWNEVQRDPAATFQRRVVAAVYFCLGAEWLKNSRCWKVEGSGGDNAPNLTLALAVLNGSVLFMFLFGLLGFRWSWSWGYQAMPTSLVLFWLPLPFILGHAERLVGPRLPLDGVLLTYAAYAVVCLLSARQSGLIRRASG